MATLPLTLPPRQQGAALLLCLIILVLVTLMGLTTMRTAIVQEKMSGANADRALAFEAAEMALRDAENHVRDHLTSESAFADECAAGLCKAPLDGTSAADDIDWDGNAASTYGQDTGAVAIGGVEKQPKYIIELLFDMQPPPGNSAKMKATGTPYRITALGYGKQKKTRVLLQSTYYKP